MNIPEQFSIERADLGPVTVMKETASCGPWTWGNWDSGVLKIKVGLGRPVGNSLWDGATLICILYSGIMIRHFRVIFPRYSILMDWKDWYFLNVHATPGPYGTACCS